MADTATEVTEKKSGNDGFVPQFEDGRVRENHVRPGAPIPPASAIDLDNLDITDPELWLRNEMWGRLSACAMKTRFITARKAL